MTQGDSLYKQHKALESIVPKYSFKGIVKANNTRTANIRSLEQTCNLSIFISHENHTLPLCLVYFVFSFSGKVGWKGNLVGEIVRGVGRFTVVSEFVDCYARVIYIFICFLFKRVDSRVQHLPFGLKNVIEYI